VSKNQENHKSRDVMSIEGSKEIGGVLHPKKIKNVIMDEIMNKEVEGEELLTFNQDTPLNETTIEGVQSESTQRQRKEWPWDWWIATKEVECATAAFLDPKILKKH